MNIRKDILKLFAGENPEYVPWFGDLAYWIDYLLDEGKMPEKYRKSEYGDVGRAETQGMASPFVGAGLHRLHRDLGVGFYLQGYFPFIIEYDLEIETEEKGNLRTTTVHTPHGELHEVWEYVYSTHSWGPREHLVKNWKDLKALRYLYAHMYYSPEYALAEQRYGSIGEDGIVLVYAPKSPFMELVALKSGIENITYMFMDAQEELEETLSAMLHKHNEALDLAIKSPAECIMVPDNLSSEVVAGLFYDSYMKDIHKTWTDKIRQSGKISFVHLDGTLTPLITELSKAGFDVIEAVTPQPVGDIALEDLRKYVKSETILWGGIPGGFFSGEVSDEEFDAFVIRAIELMKNNNRFVLGVADQVVPGASFERIKRVRELVAQYGKYD